MKRIRLFVNVPVCPGEEITIGDSQAHYLQHVMRLESGAELIIFNGRGGEYRAEIIRMGRHDVSCNVLEFNDVDRELQIGVHIVQAACRNEKIETVLQRGTELGATSFQIVVSRRSDLKLENRKLLSRLKRWQKIVIEAAEQCGRTQIPDIRWRDSLEEIEIYGAAYCLHPEGGVSWAEVRDKVCKARELIFAAGPEGGWDASDLGILERKGFLALRFGSRTLRTQTAAPALLSAVQAVLD